MENREIPIFHKFPGLRPLNTPNGVEELFVCRYLPTNKKTFSLEPLCLCGEIEEFSALLNIFLDQDMIGAQNFPIMPYPPSSIKGILKKTGIPQLRYQIKQPRRKSGFQPR
jgi:hypothetical protein